MMTRREFVSLIGFLPVPAAEAMTAPARTFHPVEIAEFAGCQETHVDITGIVTYVSREDDGDLHIRIESHADATFGVMPGEPFVVAEIVPELPVALPRRPKVGDSIRVKGIRRYDDEAAPGHHHWEVHPVVWAKLLVSVSPL